MAFIELDMKYFKIIRFCSLNLAIFFFLTSETTHAQLNPNRPLVLSSDVAQFKAPGNQCKLEIYLGIERAGLMYEEESAHYVARYHLETLVKFREDTTKLDPIQGADSVANLSQIVPGQQFVYASPIFLTPGSYIITSILTDLNNNRQTRRSHFVKVNPYPEDELTLSGIQLATRIKKAAKPAGMFDKNNLHVLPNPRGMFGDGVETFNLYAEVYNLSHSEKNRQSYRVDYHIETRDGLPLYKIAGKPRKKKQADTAFYTSFDLSSLASGRYQVRIVVTDESSGRNVAAKKPFAVYRKAEAIILMAKEERKVYDQMNEIALQNYFDQIAYIATDDEKKIFASLHTKSRKEFFVQFWLRRDPTSGTAQNEFKEDYIQRLLQAKINFSIRENDGWKMDRGRILLTYGPPDFIDREHANPAVNAYEIWHYETLEGGSKFYFVDITDNNEFRLIHSTYRNEVQNPDWQDYLYK